MFSAGTDLLSWAGEPTTRGGAYGIAGRTLSKPVIAAVEGAAVGGGFEIALAASLIVASVSAQFSLPEVGLGLVAECGGLFRSPRALPLNVAREMLLTGAPLSAERAHTLGLVNRVSDPGHALDAAMQLAQRIVTLAPLAVRETLRATTVWAASGDDCGWEATNSAKQITRASYDSTEGVAAFMERRTPQWRGR